jgi:hypothetical protein
VTALFELTFVWREMRRAGMCEFKSGNRDWVNVTASRRDRSGQTLRASTIFNDRQSLGDFRRDRGYFVVSDKESVLIDHLSPHYLARVIRVDPWAPPISLRRPAGPLLPALPGARRQAQHSGRHRRQWPLDRTRLKQTLDCRLPGVLGFLSGLFPRPAS